MQSNTPRERRASEDRAKGSASGAGRAPSTRGRAPAASTRKPSGFTTTGSARKRAPAESAGTRSGAASKSSARPKHRFWQREPNNKRKRKEHRPGQWKIPLIVAGAVVLLALIIALIVANSGRTYHQLPKITRIEDYTPEPIGTPEPTAAPESFSLPESDGLPSTEDALPGADEALPDADGGFDEDAFLEDAAALEDLLGMDGEEAGSETFDSFADAFLGDEAGA